MGLSRTTLSEITADLLRRGAITVVDTDAPTRHGSGRPAERLALDPRSGQFIGVDFQHRRVDIVVADAAHETIGSGTLRYPEDSPWGVRIATAFTLIERVASAEEAHFGALKGIAIGIPGPYVPTSQRATLTPAAASSLRTGDEVALAFTEHFGVPVQFDNNARLAVLAEAMAPGASEDLLYLRFGDGLGGGMVVGGRLALGGHALAGEFGHIAVPGATTQCRCSRVGCLETIASVGAILAECQRRGVTAETLTDLRSSDPIVAGVLAEAVAAISGAIKPVIMVLDPGEVVIGGALAQAFPELVDQLAEALASAGIPGLGRAKVRASRIPSAEGARGAVHALFATTPLLAGYADTVEGVL